MSGIRVAFSWSLLILIGFCPGCSTVYYGKWKRAQPISESTPIAGSWEGRWVSESNGHNGRLRCIVSAEENGGYDFHFWARWNVFAGTYHVEPVVTGANERYEFTGSKSLGRLVGGEYSFEGVIDGNQFNARYRSRIDHGRFEMTRRVE